MSDEGECRWLWRRSFRSQGRKTRAFHTENNVVRDRRFRPDRQDHLTVTYVGIAACLVRRQQLLAVTSADRTRRYRYRLLCRSPIDPPAPRSAKPHPAPSDHFPVSITNHDPPSSPTQL